MPPGFFIRLRLRLKALVMRRKLDRDLEDELRFHLAMRQRKLEGGGVPETESAAAARRRFGNETRVRETSRSLWTFPWIETFIRDARFALRAVAHAPVFAAVAILTLGFGIGANTAIFSIANGILLRSMPYRNADRIYSIREVVAADRERNVVSAVNGGNIVEWQRRARSFEEIAALEPSNDTLSRGSESVNIHGMRASASLFPLLGIQPRVGRAFTPEEDQRGHGLQMILTDALWRDRFGADPGIVGRQISLNGYPVTVIGVMPASFYFPKQDQLYGKALGNWTFSIQYFLNLNLAPWEQKAGMSGFNFAAIGKVGPGVSRERALAELEAIENEIGARQKTEASLHAALIPLKAAVTGPAQSRVWLLMAGGALMLIIVCVNLTGLMLGRNTTRSREVAIRLALGAGRWTVLRQFAAEGLTLAMLGGALGVLGAYAGIRLLVRYAPITLPRLESVTVDGDVLLFTAAIALGAGLLFSVLPALRLGDQKIEDTLRSSATNVSSSRRTASLHDMMAGSEIAICTVLLICAMLLGQSLSGVLRDNAWLGEERALAIQIGPSPKQYQAAATRAELYRKLIHQARELPAVTQAGLISALPLRGEVWGSQVDFAEIPMRDTRQPVANFRFLSPGYDEAIGLRLAAGRRLKDSDWGREVALISESVAREYPGRNLVGMHLNWDDIGRKVSLEVIGVLNDFRAEAEKTPVMAVYVPYWVFPPWEPSLVVRAATDPAGVGASVRRMIRDTDSEVPITRFETLREVLDSSVASRRFLTRLGVVFAASATFLAALGLYGVVSLAATRRRREIAIRMAIGASQPDVFRMVILKALRLTAISVAAGLACGIAIERVIKSLLYDVHSSGALVFGGACGIVVLTGLVAGFLPAWRATRVDPVVALKYE